MKPETMPLAELEWERLAASVAGELDPEQESELLRWASQSREREELLKDLQRIWSEGSRIAPSFDAEAALERMRSRSLPARKRALWPSSPVRRHDRILAWAAVGLLVVGIGGYAVQYQRSGRPGAQSPALTDVATAPGQRAVIQLSDGTRITLGVASTLRYAADVAGGARREVHLDGEAFFEVPSDGARQLTVHTALAEVRDLGTKFAVRAYSSHGHAEVVVAEGQVALAGAGAGPTTSPTGSPTLRGDSIVLGVAQLGRVDLTGRMQRQSGVDLDAALAWTRGELVFVEAPMQEVVERLGSWYGTEITLGDTALSQVRFTGSFEAAALESVVREIAAAVGATIQRVNGGYVLRIAR